MYLIFLQNYGNIVTELSELELKDGKISGSSYYTANVLNVFAELRNIVTELSETE